MMRITPLVSLLGVAALVAVAGCTVHDVDQPALAGPSTFAHSIILVADRNTLTQNGADFVDIRITSLSPNGQSENIPLRAQIFVDGVANDFGTLSTKNPITPATIRYTAPPASNLVNQVPTTVTVAVTPTSSGDFRSEFSREIDLRVLPQGVILPTNPNLVANFQVTPANPQVLSNVSFDASTTTNSGSACNTACTYGWDFGDGTSGTGIAASHQYRTTGTFIVQLTVTDVRGARAFSTKPVVVAPGTPPTADFTFSPTPAFVNETVFFNATISTPATGRTIVKYEWDFGKGSGGSGVTVSKAYDLAGTYTVTLTVTDDAGAVASKSKTVAVTAPVVVPDFTFLPAAPVVSQPVTFNASASTGPSPIVDYQWNFGPGATPATASGLTTSATYSSSGSKVVTLTVTDSAGRTATTNKVISVAP
jgi:PKD repeat protein